MRTPKPRLLNSAPILLGVLLLAASCSTSPPPYGVLPVDIPDVASLGESERKLNSILNPQAKQLKVGDKVRILTADGYRRSQMKILEFKEDSFLLKKSVWSDRKIWIHFDDIVFLESKVQTGEQVWSLFPILEKSKEEDAFMNCTDLQREILHANVLRRSINAEIASMGASAGLSMLSWSLGIPAGPGYYQAQLERNEKARSAAEQRVIELLAIYTSQGCQTEKKKMLTPEEAHQQIQDLEGQLASDDINEKQHERRLRAILDKLPFKKTQQ
ncbi:hypothetical protein [Pelagicoccus mobilis]|uniref:Lipoprotein n=1 Tax=Pelagicoccus mobilis TaxID=415221 RepID=A0A934VME2_9BACT|nr:hypothetical protein [Pelagicoccus mobilis]MBK1878751.1 hypothetical protein [Pelagicoccus mobilis]